MEIELYKLLDDLELNLTIKRHNSNGKFDARIYHPWVCNPILSSIGKDSFQECMIDFFNRKQAIENMRKHLEKLKKKRRELDSKKEKYPEPFHWENWV